jgi:hypothetical protein
VPLERLDVGAVVVNVRVAKMQQADRAANLDANRNELRRLFMLALVGELALALLDQLID